MPADLTTPTARKRVPRGRIVWKGIGGGRSLGYRRPQHGAGQWWVRVHVGGESGSPYRKRSFATADDVAESDGSEILTYSEAIAAAADWNPWVGISERPAGPEKPEAAPEALEGLAPPPRKVTTVGDAVLTYLWAKAKAKSVRQLRYELERHVVPDIGDLPIRQLTRQALEAWHRRVSQSPIRRGKDKEGNPVLDYPKTDEEKRARKVTANRALKDLKAALNLCADEGKIDPGPWSRVKPFRDVEVARPRYLDAQEIPLLLEACRADLRDLVAAALLTGARYGELARLRVDDYRRSEESVWIRHSKADRSRHVYLSGEGLELFDRLTEGKASDDLILTKKDGSAWGKGHHIRHVRKAVDAAELEPPITFHGLRHTYASHYLMNGGSLVALAKQLGHTTTRMVEKYYGHLAEGWRKEEAKRRAPRIEPKTADVVDIAERRS